jgi:putative membrane protein
VTAPSTPSAEHLAAERTNLAAVRTLMSADRTLMAWVRTSLSLLTFAFTIYRILQDLPLLANRTPNQASARTIGLFLAAMGTFAMVMGTVDYLHTLRMVQQQQHFSFRRPALIMAFIMSFMGIALFLSISTRLL